jgi:hypothetical protein
MDITVAANNAPYHFLFKKRYLARYNSKDKLWYYVFSIVLEDNFYFQLFLCVFTIIKIIINFGIKYVFLNRNLSASWVKAGKH